jgi:hypothetical protein
LIGAHGHRSEHRLASLGIRERVLGYATALVKYGD